MAKPLKSINTQKEVSKQFNIEERVAIGEAAEDLLGERRGRPEIEADKCANVGTLNDEPQIEIKSGRMPTLNNKPQIEKSANVGTLNNNIKTGIKTRDIAAKKAGFGSSRTYAKAQTIIEKATLF